MLVGEGLAVGGVEGDVLRCAFKRCAKAEQLAVAAPAGALLGFLANIAEIGNGFFTKYLGIFHGVNQGINQASKALLGNDREISTELFNGTNPPTQEVAEGQFHHTAVGEAAVKLLEILVAAAQAANEFAHGDLTLAQLGGLHRADHLAIALDDVSLKNLAVGGANHLGLLAAGHGCLEHITG